MIDRGKEEKKGKKEKKRKKERRKEGRNSPIRLND